MVGAGRNIQEREAMNYPEPFSLNRIRVESDSARRRAERRQRDSGPYAAVSILAVMAGLLIVAMAAL